LHDSLIQQKACFGFLDVLLSGATLVVEAGNALRLHRQVGDDEANLWEQLAQMPFDLGDDAALLVPALCLVMEVFEEPFDLGQRRTSDRPGKPVHDLLAQDGIGGPADDVEVARLFKPCVDRGAGIGGVGAARSGHQACGQRSGRLPGRAHPASRRRCGRCRAAGRSVPAFRTG